MIPVEYNNQQILSFIYSTMYLRVTYYLNMQNEEQLVAMNYITI